MAFAKHYTPEERAQLIELARTVGRVHGDIIARHFNELDKIIRTWPDLSPQTRRRVLEIIREDPKERN